jgi:hypothetical protein
MFFIFKSIYSPNDITIISNEKIDDDELIEYVISHAIDLVISINTKSQLLSGNFRKIKPTQNSEKTLDTSNIKELSRKKIDYKFKVSGYNCDLMLKYEE